MEKCQKIKKGEKMNKIQKLITNTITIGIDISKEFFDIYVYESGKTMRFDNNSRGIKKFIKYITPLNPTLVAMEYTGGLERQLFFALQDYNIPCCCIKPINIKNFAKTIDAKAKTDLISAKLIAHYAFLYKPAPQPKPDEKSLLLKDLASRLQSLTDFLISEKNRLASSTFAKIKSQIKKSIKSVEKLIEDGKKQLKELVYSDPILKARVELLDTMPGVGEYSAMMLAVLLPELGTISGKQIASLCGVAPFINQSGKAIGKAFIKGGRDKARRVLFLITLAAIVHNPLIREYYNRLIFKGKPPKVAIVACMRKIIRILNAMIRDNRPFIPDYYETYVREQDNGYKIILTKNNEIKQEVNYNEVDYNSVLSNVNFFKENDRETDMKNIT
jgi:transposase